MAALTAAVAAYRRSRARSGSAVDDRPRDGVVESTQNCIRAVSRWRRIEMPGWHITGN